MLAVAGAVVFAVAQTNRQTAAPAATETPAAVDVTQAVGSVPASVFDSVGAGTAKAAPSKIDAPPLTQGPLPEVLYIGGEFCPFCAAERWPLAVALSRFGSFSNLGQITSAPSPEVYPNTATLSFHGASFTSSYLALTAKEIFDQQHNPLDQLTDAEQQNLSTYDAPPYTQTAGSIPFVNIGGGWVISGAQFDPAVLAGKSHAQIAAALSDPGSPIAKAVIGTANVISVALCEQTGGQPVSVCQSSGVQAAATAMGTQ